MGKEGNLTYLERTILKTTHQYVYMYLNPAEDGLELYQGVQNHMGYKNNKIQHSTRETPNEKNQELIQ
jgi:hypothetical protein